MSITVGIDVSASEVRVAVMRAAYRKTTLEALARAEVAASGGVVEAIRAATTAALAGKPADAVATAIEGVKTAVHVLALPASAQKQIAEVLPFELEAALPVDMAESVFDYRLLATRREGAEDGGAAMLDVLACVARIEDVRARIELVKEGTGVEPERVGAGALPLSNLIASTPGLVDPQPILLLDLGAELSEVLVVVNGEPALARTLSWGTAGLPANASKLARELRVTIGAWRAQGGAPPARVYLAGNPVGGSEAFLATALDLPVEPLPPVSLDLTVVGPERAAELPQYAKALGLALSLTGRASGLDLRRGPLAYERGFAWIREKIPVVAGLAAVVVVSFLFSAWTQLYAANKDRGVYEAALASVTKDVLGEETSDPARAQDLLAQQSGGADDDPMPHVDAFDVMVKLSEDIPPSTTHDVEELDVNKQHATVHGIVGAIPEAQSIKTALEQEKCFQGVNVSRFNQQVGGERQKYVLELDMRCPEDGGGKKKKSGGASPASSGGGE